MPPPRVRTPPSTERTDPGTPASAARHGGPAPAARSRASAPDDPGAPTSAFPTTRFDPLAEDRARVAARAAAALDVCRPALALRALLLVQAVLAVSALAGADSADQWLQRQATHAWAGAAGTLLWLVATCALQPLLRRWPAPARAAMLAAGGAAAALAAWSPLPALGLADPASGLRVAGVAAAGAGFAALLAAWLALRAQLWEPATSRARLSELQSRIRPHFLFNALNTALALVRVDPARAERVLEDLGELFRVALAEAGASVSLDEELALARAYLAIEQVRFGDRLQLDWSLDAGAAAARVPPLLLQPLVENAVRHGVEPAPGGGRVWVRTEARRGSAVVTVVNTLPDAPGAPGHGMALHNLRERLRLLHDVAAQCDTWREGDCFHARVVVPLS